MIPKMIDHIEATGQEVLGNLRFETVVMDAGWKIDDKGHRYWREKNTCICRFLKPISH